MQDASDLLVDTAVFELALVFAPGGAETVIGFIEAKVAELPVPDVATATSRAALAALAYRVARTKTALDNLGKDFVATLKEKTKAVDIERKAIRDRLDALRDSVRRPLTDWEDAEKARIAEHEEMLAELTNAVIFDDPEPTAAEIANRIAQLGALGGNHDWHEFERRADLARADSKAKLKILLGCAKKRDAERAELDALLRREAQHVEDAKVAKAAEATIARVRLEAAADVAAANQRAASAVEAAAVSAPLPVAPKPDLARARAVHSAAYEAFRAHCGLSPDLARAVVTAIAQSLISHVHIEYGETP